MESLDILFASFWNNLIILSVLVIFVVFIIELEGLNRYNKEDQIEKHQDNSKKDKRFRKNKDYIAKLLEIDSENFKNSLFVIHSDFKSLLENKFKLNPPQKRVDNTFYLDYISNPELKEFMRNPLQWFQPHFTGVMNIFSGSKRLNHLKGSKILLPVFLDLERKIIDEIDDTIKFNYVKIDKDYENHLVNRILQRNRIITFGAIAVDIAFGAFLILLQINFLEMLILVLIGLVLIYAFNKLNSF